MEKLSRFIAILILTIIVIGIQHYAFAFVSEAEIVDSRVYVSKYKPVKPGDVVEVWLRIELKGTESKNSYYVGYSVQDKFGNWWDAPYIDGISNPTDRDSHSLFWKVPYNAPEGWYTVRIAVWQGVDTSVYPHRLLNRLDYVDMPNAFMVERPYINAAIQFVGMPSGTYSYGDLVRVVVPIENKGSEHTFYIGYSVQDKFGNWWDAPYKELTLEEKQSGQDELTWKVPETAPQGWYTIRVALWEGVDRSVYPHRLLNRLDYLDIQNAFQVGVVAIEQNKNLVNENVNTNTNEKTGGCLIATATYGSELASQVHMLREIRDNVVFSTYSGTAFMSAFNAFYYSFSPTIADLERQNSVFKELVKVAITPMILTLSILEYVDIDSEGKMITYGTGVILLNTAIYFLVPIFAIKTLRTFRS